MIGFAAVCVSSWRELMSALGHKRTCAVHKPMSALCQKRTLLRVRSRGQWLRFLQEEGRKLLVFIQEFFDVILHRDIGMNKRPKMSGSDKSE